MEISDIKKDIPSELYEVLDSHGIKEFRPGQGKAIKAGLLKGKNLLICTPTASGKTLISELAFVTNIMNRKGKGIYIVPLKALATDKFRDFKEKYEKHFKIALSIGDLDSSDPYLKDYDLIITTSEKLDSLIRHSAEWLKDVKTVVVDEVHLLNDHSRGPTLEILLTMLIKMLKEVQIIALSATIGNPQELADWLDAKLIADTWRPVTLHRGIYHEGKVEFFKSKV